MKTLSILALVLAVTTTARADLKSDHDSIAAMKGCYEVTFHFQETGTTDPNYPIHSPEFNDHGLEWVELDKDTGTVLSLQHILITPQGPLKHWRQQWEYEATNPLYFQGPASNALPTWKTANLSASDVAGKWMQRVYQVDDSPRYECVAQWNFDATTGEAFWECATFAPLPRREFSQRSDYNILDRTNKHIITKDGWLHDQSNRKVLLKDGMTSQIATEKGLDTYRRVDDARCLDAQTYWKENKSIWNTISGMWTHVSGHHPEFSLRSKVNGKLLWETLFELAETTLEEVKTQGTLDVKALSKKAHDQIHGYMIVAGEDEEGHVKPESR